MGIEIQFFTQCIRAERKKRDVQNGDSRPLSYYCGLRSQKILLLTLLTLINKATIGVNGIVGFRLDFFAHP